MSDDRFPELNFIMVTNLLLPTSESLTESNIQNTVYLQFKWQGEPDFQKSTCSQLCEHFFHVSYLWRNCNEIKSTKNSYFADFETKNIVHLYLQLP